MDVEFADFAPQRLDLQSQAGNLSLHCLKRSYEIVEVGWDRFLGHQVVDQLGVAHIGNDIGVM